MVTMYNKGKHQDKDSRQVTQMPQPRDPRINNCSTGAAISKIAVGISNQSVSLTPTSHLTASLITNLASHNGIPQSQFYNKQMGPKLSMAPMAVAAAAASASVAASSRSLQQAQGQQFQQRQPSQQPTQGKGSELQRLHGHHDQQNSLLKVQNKILHNSRAPEIIDLSMDDTSPIRSSELTSSATLSQDSQTQNSAILSSKKPTTTTTTTTTITTITTTTTATVKRKSTPKRLATSADNLNTDDTVAPKEPTKPMTGDKPPHLSSKANRSSGYNYANSISPSKLPLPRPLPPATDQINGHLYQPIPRPSVQTNATRTPVPLILGSKSAHKVAMQAPISKVSTQPVVALPRGESIPIDAPFSWDIYLKLMPAEFAPREAFRQSEQKLKNNFLPGMKLQASDPRSSSWSLASVLVTDGPRMRIRFDGSDKQNDLFELVDSDKIKPVDQHSLMMMLPPMNYLLNIAQYHKFVETELTKPGVVVAPPEYFYPISEKPKRNLFRPGMKIEAMDRRNPSNIYPATVTQVEGDRVSYGFDGWPSVVYSCDYWSSELFPINWCRDNGHVIVAPEGWDTLLSEGIPVRLPSESVKPSTPTVTKDTARGRRGATTPSSERKPPAKRNSKNHEKAKRTKKVKAAEPTTCSPANSKKSQIGRSPDSGPSKSSKKQVLESSFEDDDNYDEDDQNARNDDETEPGEMHSASPTPEDINCKPEGFQCQRIVPVPDYFCAKKAATSEAEKIDKPVANWTVEDVKTFVSQDPSLVKHLKIFDDHEIDGKAFLLLKSEMMLTHLGLKMGPTLKIQDLVNEAQRRR